MAINDVECCEAVHIHSDVLEKINMDMPDEDELYDLAELFKVFGDSTRIRICMFCLNRKHVYVI